MSTNKKMFIFIYKKNSQTKGAFFFFKRCIFAINNQLYKSEIK